MILRDEDGDRENIVRSCDQSVQVFETAAGDVILSKVRWNIE